MIITGQVVKTTSSLAYIKTARPKSCEHCSSSAVCNTETLEIRALNNTNSKVGDFVSVEIEEDKTTILLFAYIFLVPVLILFISYYLYTLYPLLAFLAIPMTGVYIIYLLHLNKTHKTNAKILGAAAQENNCGCQNTPE